MKRIALFLLLFGTKLGFAQSFNFGISGGYLAYNFGSHSRDFNHNTVSLGVCSQYVFKDSLFGIEGNLLLYNAPPVFGSNSGAFAPYFFFNVAPHHKTSLELKLGLLSYHTFGTTNPPLNDIGPSGGLYVYIVPLHAPEMGLDLTLFLGQEHYLLQEAGSVGGAPIPAYSAQLLTVNLSFKLMVP